MSKKKPTVTMPIAMWGAAKKRIAELENTLLEKREHNLELAKRVDRLLIENKRLRELLKRVDGGYVDGDYSIDATLYVDIKAALEWGE